MRSLLTALLTLTATTAVTAQSNYPNQTAPFNLVVLSGNSTINGSSLSSCHVGAAIESLCLGPKTLHANSSLSTYNLNFTSYSTSYNATIGQQGVLTWVLPSTQFFESEPMTLYSDPTTNVGLPLFEPTETGTLVAFDRNDLLNIQGYVDDTVTPPVAGPQKAYYRWWVCKVNYSGYVYEDLAWVYGDRKPENPSCVKVEVKRLFL